jgi:transposase-like protein
MLVLIGATPEGKKELIGFKTGMRESAQSWKELLVDLKARDLSIAPEIAVGDGALGFWRALDEAFPSTRHQRCWQHKTLNVLDKLPKSVKWPGATSGPRVKSTASDAPSTTKNSKTRSRLWQRLPPSSRKVAAVVKQPNVTFLMKWNDP